MATFKINPYYPGNYEGVKPVIESLELREIKYDTALDQLAEGTLDVVHKATEGSFIDEGVARFGEGVAGGASGDGDVPESRCVHPRFPG